MSDILTKDDLIRRLKAESGNDDTEDAHANADWLLLTYIGDREIAEAYAVVPKWYA